MADILPFRTKQQRQTGTGLRDLAVYECPSGHGTFSHPLPKGAEVPKSRPCPACGSDSLFSHRKHEAAPYRK